MNIPRYFEGARPADTFEDMVAPTEMQSLGGTEAAQQTERLQEVIRPNGVEMQWTCNCSRPYGILVAWHEMACIAHGIKPDQTVSIQGRPTQIATDPWLVDNTRNFIPAISTQCPCGNPRPIVIAKRDAERSLQQAISHGFTQHDDRYPLAQALLNPMRMQQRLEPI